MGMKNEIVFTQSVRELCEKPLYIHSDSTNIYTFYFPMVPGYIYQFSSVYPVIKNDGKNMKKVEDCNNLGEIRAAINKIDENIGNLIAQRSRYVKKAAEFKKDEKVVKDKKRVEEVIKTKKALVEKYGISPVLIETLYTNMIVLLSGKKRKNGKSDSIKFYRRYIPGFYEY